MRFKKHSYVCFLLLFHLNVFSQVTYCPPGAEWRYSFLNDNLSTEPKFLNEKMSYVRDSILGNDTVKVLQHKRIYIFANEANYGPSLIKQKGDTVFVRNGLTNHTWQILYNFNAKVGEGWVTHWLKISYDFMFFVDSVKYVNIQGRTLKRLVSSTGDYATERIGGQWGFLLAKNGPFSDGDMFHKFLCYSDDQIGTLEFSELPCEFTGSVGVMESEGRERAVRVFPNPTNEEVTVETDLLPAQLLLFDGRGSLIWQRDITGSTHLNIRDLATGMYLLQVKENNGITTSFRLLKD